MIDFQYEGVASDGKACRGAIRAPSEETARLAEEIRNMIPYEMLDD